MALAKWHWVSITVHTVVAFRVPSSGAQDARKSSKFALAVGIRPAIAVRIDNKNYVHSDARPANDTVVSRCGPDGAGIWSHFFKR
jgi:hypothetical protein